MVNNNIAQLVNKCEKIRNLFISHSAFHPGFHLAPALGLVEVAVALSGVFDFNKEQIIFDIGHQRYPFLMLEEEKRTGELKIPERELEYNFFRHPAFAGLSTAMAAGVLKYNKNIRPIIIVGDGAFNAGEIYEGLNNINENLNFILIYNENGMSIKENVGLLRDDTKLKLFANSLGMQYTGIIDGHNLDILCNTFLNLKNVSGKHFIHVRTKKGKGYKPAEDNPLAFHQPFLCFEKDTGEFTGTDDQSINNFFHYLTSLDEIAVESININKEVIFTIASTPPLIKLQEIHPNHFIDFGIAEQCCITSSTAMALLGKKIVTVMFSTFLSRCYSQLLDLCLANANVLIIAFYPGTTPFGFYQQATHLLGILKNLPNLEIMCPANFKEFNDILNLMINRNGPRVILVPKENPTLLNIDDENVDYLKSSYITRGDSATVIPIGSIFENTLKIYEKFGDVDIINLHSLKPLDYNKIKESVARTGKLFFIEDGYLASSLSNDIVAYLNSIGLRFDSKILAVPDIFIRSHHYITTQELTGLSQDSILKGFTEFLGSAYLKGKFSNNTEMMNTKIANCDAN